MHDRSEAIPHELKQLRDGLRNAHLSRLAERRPRVGYSHAFLDSYRPNDSAYLSFNDVPRDYYTDAVALIYEQHDIGLMKALFIWAYGRSAVRYGAIRQTAGEPDPFRMRHRESLRELIGKIIRDRLDIG